MPVKIVNGFTTISRDIPKRRSIGMAEPMIHISDGYLRGQVKENLKEEIFLSFEGIPYGEPPVGKLRFKAPVPVKPWEGVKDARARDLGNFCKHLELVQDPESGGIRYEWQLEGSEDCLNLNVYTRQLPKPGITSPKPVMLFIHGGGFSIGSTRLYGPEALMTEDVVLVTIHYRLGAFGFLVLEDPELGITGNAGLKDQVLALKWVQKNISFFNGDPNNVTIFGQSAGGASVNFLILSPLAKGLFHKAIIHSGSAINHWAKGDRQNAKHLAETLCCMKTNDHDILQFLQDLPPEIIYAGQLKLQDIAQASCVRHFAPVIEPKGIKGTFLTEEPIELMTSGKYNHVPIMAGFTDMESMHSLVCDSNSPINILCFEEDTLPPFWLGLSKGTEEFKQVARKIRKFYFGKKEPEQVSLQSCLLATDSSIVRGVIKTAEHISKTTAEPVYLFRMRTPMDNGEHLLSKDITGVPHGGELLHLFKLSMEAKHLAGNEEIVRKRLIKLWTNFAKYGNPTPTTDELIPVKWTPIGNNQLNFLDIENDLVMDVNPEKERMEFWDELFRSYPHAKDY